ncbi:hypothetical protein FKP32DRAFT_1677372 [Trametes sanguinea]|nr:hypothetical protein FKP32DRAFT_1677372 [Trametes sanguinea]
MSGGHDEQHRERIEAMRAAMRDAQGATPAIAGAGVARTPVQYWPKERGGEDENTPSTDEEERLLWAQLASPAEPNERTGSGMGSYASPDRPGTPTPRSRSLAYDRAGGEAGMAGAAADPFGGSPEASELGEERLRRNLFYPQRAHRAEVGVAGRLAMDSHLGDTSGEGGARARYAQEKRDDTQNPFLTSLPTPRHPEGGGTELRLKKRPRVDSSDEGDAAQDKGKGREVEVWPHQGAPIQGQESRTTPAQSDVPPPYALSFEANNQYLKKLFDEAVEARVRELLTARDAQEPPALASDGGLGAWMDDALRNAGWPQIADGQDGGAPWAATSGAASATQPVEPVGAGDRGEWGAAPWNEQRALSAATPAPQVPRGQMLPPQPPTARRDAPTMSQARLPPPVPFSTRPAAAAGQQGWSTPRHNSQAAHLGAAQANEPGPSHTSRAGWPSVLGTGGRAVLSAAVDTWPSMSGPDGAQRMDVDEHPAAATTFPATPTAGPRAATNAAHAPMYPRGQQTAEASIPPLQAPVRIVLGMRLVPWGARIGSVTMELRTDSQGRTYGEYLTSTGVLRVTPPPKGGYPRKHLKSPRDLIRLIPQAAVDLWLAQDEEMRIMLEVYGEGEMTHERAQELSESMSNTVTAITNERGTFVLTAPSLLGRGVKVRRDTSAVWMMTGLSARGTSLVLAQGMWSTPDGTFFVHKLHVEMPEYIFSLVGFTHCVGNTIEEGFKAHFRAGGRIFTSIVNLVNEDPARRAYSHQIAMDIEKTVRIDVVQYPSVDGVRPGRIVANVYCAPPVNNAERWESWRDSFLTKKFTCDYHSECEAILLKRCEGCHGGDHETAVCPYPRIEGFYGKIRNASGGRKGGSGKARDSQFGGRGDRDRDDSRWQQGWSDRKSSDQRKGRGDPSRPSKWK